MASIPRDFIECGICFEILKKPKSLKCRHVFCEECIQKLLKGTKVQCPVCREDSFKIEIKPDFRTQELIDKYNNASADNNTPTDKLQQIPCDVCKKNKLIKSFCPQCDQLLCCDCDTAHSGLASTKSHKLSDFKTLCADKTAMVSKQITILKKRKKEVQSSVSNIDKIMEQLVVNKADCINEVNRQREMIKRKVDQHHDKLIEEINSVMNTKTDTLNRTNSSLKDISQNISAKVSNLEEIVKSQNYAKLVKTLSTTEEDISRIVEQISRERHELDPTVGSPVQVIQGEEWDPKKSTRIRGTDVAQSIIRGVTDSPVLQDGVDKKHIHKRYKHLKCLELEYCPFDISLYMDEVWVVTYDKGNYKYDLDLKQLKHFQHDDKYQNACSILRTNSGVIVCDSKTGLHLIDPDGKYLCAIHPGQFSSICLYGNQLYALEYKECRIFGFNWNCNTWEKGPEYKLSQYSEGYEYDRLCTSGSHFYISNVTKHTILVYSMTGELVYKTGGRGSEVGLFRLPYITEADSCGKVLVCDYLNDRLQVLDTETQIWSVIQGCGGVEKPRAATLSNRHMWVCSGNWKLFKFENA